MRKLIAIITALGLSINLVVPIIYTAIAYPLEKVELKDIAKRLKGTKSVSLNIDRLVVKINSNEEPVIKRNSFIVNKDTQDTLWVSGNKYSYWIKHNKEYEVEEGVLGDIESESKYSSPDNPLELNPWGFLDDIYGYRKEPELSLFTTHNLDLSRVKKNCLVFRKIYSSSTNNYVATYYVDIESLLPVGYILNDDNKKEETSTTWRYEFNYMDTMVDIVEQINIIKGSEVSLVGKEKNN